MEHEITYMPDSPFNRTQFPYKEWTALNKEIKFKFIRGVDMTKTIQQLKTVLCDPEGTPCISGSKVDNEIIAECLKELEDHADTVKFLNGEIQDRDESLRTVRNTLELKSRTAALRSKRIERLEMKVAKLKQLILLTDPAVHDVQMNDLTRRQWKEYTEWCNELEGVQHDG